MSGQHINGNGLSQPRAGLAVYNMKAVVMETGLNPTTIRAWERRYGLPEPDRSQGGHRQYTLRDIDTLKWLIARQEEGLSISHAVDLWRQMEAQGRDPLAPGGRSAVEGPSQGLPRFSDGEPLSNLRQGWVEACLAFDRSTAEQIMNEAFSRFAPETVVIELLQNGVAAMGRGWYEGEITIRQEHFASELAVRRLETLIAGAAPPTRAGKLVLASAPKDDHTISLLLLNFLLRRDGWEVLNLGANVPVAEIVETVRRVKARLTIVAAQRLYTAATLADVAWALQAEDTVLAFGGAVFSYLPDLPKRIPGHYLGHSLAAVPRRVTELLRQRPAIGESLAVDRPYQQALNTFQERRALVESHIWGTFVATGEDTTNLAQINQDLAESIMAALKLADIDLLPYDRGWFEHLLISYRLPAQALRRYLQCYYQAARIHLGESASMVVAWLARVQEAAEAEQVEAAVAA